MNNQIYITAAVITCFALIILFLIQFTLKFNWKFYWLPCISMLPVSFIINFTAKNWLLGALSLWTPQNQLVIFLVYYVIWVLIIGITEELIKIVPIALPPLRNHMKETEVGKIEIGWALGTGFGIGEVWYLAYVLSIGTSIDGFLWYQLTGFIFERLLVIFVHAAFTILALYGFNKRKLWLTIIMAILVHGIIDYIAIASHYISIIYLLFVIISLLGITLIIIAYLFAQTNDKKSKWRSTLQNENQSPLLQNDDEEPEVISLFPSKE